MNECCLHLGHMSFGHRDALFSFNSKYIFLGRHVFVLVGSNPTVVTTMEPGLLRGPGVEAERAVPEVWYSSRSGSRSGEGVAVLRSLDDRPHSGRTLKTFLSYM